MIVQKVIKHGNSLAVVIPTAVCRDLNIKRGDLVVATITLNSKLQMIFSFNPALKRFLQKEYLKSHPQKKHG